MSTSLLRTPALPEEPRRSGRDVLAFLDVGESAPGDPPVKLDRDWLLSLAGALQTTLDVESLIGLFGQHSRALVPHDSVSYHYVAADIRVEFGTGGEHQYSYDLVLEDREFGTVVFGRSKPFSERESAVLETVLANLVYPLRNALMYREALQAAARDPLTGVNNRASLRATLDREVELARRHHTPLSLIMVDADRFKTINDRHGHVAGDMVLRTLADCICDTTRDSDIVFRYGGEEFCILLSNTALAGAKRLAERMRKAVEELVVRARREEIGLTVSQGVAALAAGDDGLRLLEKADAALYLSKARGRNCVVTQPESV